MTQPLVFPALLTIHWIIQPNFVFLAGKTLIITHLMKHATNAHRIAIPVFLMLQPMVQLAKFVNTTIRSIPPMINARLAPMVPIIIHQIIHVYLVQTTVQFAIIIPPIVQSLVVLAMLTLSWIIIRSVINVQLVPTVIQPMTPV